MGVLQVAFLKTDGHEDVGGGHYREKQMRGAHSRGAPEGKEPTDVKRVTDHLVGPRFSETEGGVGTLAEMDPNLAQAEQVKMVDEKSCHEHEQPAEGKTTIKQAATDSVVYLPNDPAQRLPETEEENECDRGGQGVGA